MSEYKNDKEMYEDLYGKEEGSKKFNKKQKKFAIIEEAKSLVERRWKEEFPEEDLSGPKKPYAYYWFNSRPAG